MNKPPTMTIAFFGCLMLTMAAGASDPPAAPASAPASQPAASQPARPEPPRAELSNGLLSIAVTLPQEGFTGDSRFDWSGRVSFAEYQGHTFIGRWRTDAATAQRYRSHHWAGTSDEFNDVQPIELEDDPKNPERQRFKSGIKIGVGRLERQTEGKRERVVLAQPGQWNVTVGRDFVEFVQDLADSGYGYSYAKRVTLAKDEPSFSISHLLRNTGSRPIRTRSYCHNWMLVDGQGIGPQYRFTFPFELSPVLKDGKPVFKEASGARIAGREINFLGDSKRGTFYCELEGFKGVQDNQVVVENLKAGAGWKISGDWPLSEYHIYATGGEVCPEPFINIDLAAGQEQAWTARYTFFTFPPQAPASAPASAPSPGSTTAARPPG